MAVYGLIGYPLAHSFSGKYFNERFKAGSLPHSFENFPIKEISELPSIIKKGVAGLAVTIPHKEAVLPYLDELDPVAEAIGAVNCITINNGISRGHNTDAAGFEKSLPVLKKNVKALVLGSGGASKAVCYVLERKQIPYSIVSRQSSKGKNYASLTAEDIREHLLIINTTPLGMYPGVSSKPSIPYHALTPEHFLYDLVYNPEETAFLKEGIERGAQIKNGLEMLYNQAEENWRLWFNQ